MPDGLITSRPLQNEATGIDLQVPLYQEIRGSMMTGHVEYQIVVVTRLAAFKNTKHKPGDVVQLVVSKKYSEIDELYCSLAAHYPSVHLPAMPRKALFVTEADIRERRTAFDELVRFISKHPTLSVCPELFEFLGVKNTAHDAKPSNTPDWLVEDDDPGLDFFGKNEAPSIQSKQVKKSAKEEKAHDLEEDDDDEEELFDPLGGVRSKKPKAAVAKPAPKPKLSLFDEENHSDDELFQLARKDNTVKLFEDPDLGGAVALGDSLLLFNTCQNTAASVSSQLDEDVNELFRVEEDLDKLLVINKPVRPKPAIAPKPQVSVKVSPAVPQKPPGPQTQAGGAPPPAGPAPPMDQRDILKYIQQNEAAASEDLDLF